MARRIRAASAALTAEEVAETGKPAATAASEVEGAAQYFEFYGEVINAAGGETIDLGATSTRSPATSRSAWSA